MGSNFNFKSFGNDPPADGSGNKLPGNDQLARQLSIYSLTFDELQSTIGSLGKDYGSMNMDELLKNIWSAEENQSMAMPSGTAGTGRDVGGVPLQKQGSLTLPRTLSQKTVDEVWKDISKDESGSGRSNMPQTQRQQTLGEMTLEEFLFKAGVVREDAQLNVKPPNAGGIFGGMFMNESSRSNNPNGLGLGFQQMDMSTGLMGNQRNDQIPIQSAKLPLNVNVIRSNQPQLSQQQQQKQLQPQQQQQHQQKIFPKQPAVSYGYQLPLPTSTQLVGAGLKGGIMGISTEHGLNNNGLVQGGGMGMLGLGAGGVTVATGSPANFSSDGMKSNGDTLSVSPVPYLFNGGLRGRKRSGAVEKVVERRQRRMIKNRESAARSRARKQAYTTELEAEVQKLKEENQDLQKKQAQMMEMQKTQVMEMMDRKGGAKRRCLRRTQTGPW